MSPGSCMPSWDPGGSSPSALPPLPGRGRAVLSPCSGQLGCGRWPLAARRAGLDLQASRQAPAGDREGLCGDVTLRLLSPVKDRSEEPLGAGVLRSRDAQSGMLHSPEQQSKQGGQFGLRPGKYLEAGFQAGGQGFRVAQQSPSSSFHPLPAGCHRPGQD